MKKSVFLVAAALFVFSATASAQFVTSSSNSASKAASSPDIEAAFSTFDITYSPVTFKADYDDDNGDTESEDLNAVSLNWMRADVLPVNLPLYIQYGVGLQYAFMTDSVSEGDYYSYKTSVSFLTAKVPVNVLYAYTIPNTQVSLMPYLGLNLQGHLLGQEKYTIEYDGEKETEKINYFSEDDMGDEKFNRFVLGWQVGAKVSFMQFIAGVAYEGPVTNLYKDKHYKINTSQINITLGIKF
ncbi:MAG: outer membrane beta-barrel protein [Bacteroidales bacterium]|nr:outer membrane beta-barrel protein [Bacteroidales bacterium]